MFPLNTSFHSFIAIFPRRFFFRKKEKKLPKELTLPLHFKHRTCVEAQSREQLKCMFYFTEQQYFTPVSLNKEQERKPSPLFGPGDKYFHSIQKIRTSVLVEDKISSYLYSLPSKSLLLKKVDVDV